LAAQGGPKLTGRNVTERKAPLLVPVPPLLAYMLHEASTELIFLGFRNAVGVTL
jgi:hypothetical protein